MYISLEWGLRRVLIVHALTLVQNLAVEAGGLGVGNPAVQARPMGQGKGTVLS